MKMRFEPQRAAWWDGVMLAFLVVAMCSQINLGDIGQDTFATEGYVTKQLKIALPDIALMLNFLWFVMRTSVLRAWKRLWWPPLPCWALLFAMSLSLVHSPAIWNRASNAISSAREELPEGSPAPSRQAETKLALKDKEVRQGLKEGVAETVQFALYFLVAPVLFVNLMRDRRHIVPTIDTTNSNTEIDRTRLAMNALGIGATLVIGLALSQLRVAVRESPHAWFGSPNAYAAWLAIVAPLLLVWMQSDARLGRLRRLALPLIVVALVSVMSLWAHIALVLGLIAATILGRGVQTVRLGVTTLIVAIFCGALWLQSPRDARRDTFARIDNPIAETPRGKLVKKQFIEWGASAGWSAQREPAFATGVGPGNYQSSIGSYYVGLPNEAKMPPDSNNLYLVQAVSLGALGLGALLWTIGHFAALALRACKYLQITGTSQNEAGGARAGQIASANWLALGVLASLVSWAWVNLFHAAIVRGTGVVLAFLFALAVVCAWRIENAQSDADANEMNAAGASSV